MKIRFPEHLTGDVTSEPLRAINQANAPIRLVAELQMETGWDLKTFRQAATSMYTFAMTAWLTLHNAGFTSITWDQAAELSTSDLEFIEEPGDRAAAEQAAAAAGEGDASDPASPASSPASAQPKAKAEPGTRSKSLSRGSRAKSANASRTS